MSAAEMFFVALAVAGALFYLGRRAWRHFAGHGGGSCGQCPAVSRKIRLAGRGARGSIKV